MEVWCGMIMGFDSDDATIFDRQIEFIQQSRISFSMSGMLTAIPKTPLHERLAAEGRLDLADRSEYGTNVIPLQISREELLDGYFRVLNELYEPEAYFERTDALFLKPDFEIGIINKRTWWRLSRTLADLGMPDGDREPRPLLPADDEGPRARAAARVPQAAAGASSRSTAGPGLLLFYVFHLVMHYHAWKMAKAMSSREAQSGQLVLMSNRWRSR